MAGEPVVSLQNDALRALLVGAYVTAYRGGEDGPGEFFQTNGVYQRNGGRGAIVSQGTFEIRDGAICVSGDGVAARCRRLLANGDGTYTFIDTADGSAAVMTITRLR